MTESYDYIIVGAGSAGCVMANRLSETGDKVLLLEAGPMDRNLMIHIPAGVYSVYRDPRINWNYQTEDEPALDGRNVSMPRGKVVGGSSSINSMVYMRGHPLDYDRWEADYDLPGWSYADCLPYFKAGEASDRGADDWRGDSGPLGVTRGGLDNPLYDAFIEAGAQAGQGRSEDLNGYNPEGVARFDATKRNGRRCSAAVAHLRPALARENLTLMTDVLARRILFDGVRAEGIEFDRRGERRQAYAAKEVILCGGAINSPQLLMLSGVGPGDDLRALGIEPVIDAKGVGQNLMDHPTVVVQYACRKPVTIDYLQNPIHKAMAGARWLISQTGPAASNVWEAGGLVRGNADVPYPNLQYHFGPVAADFEGGRMKLFQAFSIHIDQLRPRFRGKVRLTSADPTAKPALHFNYLTTPHDEREIIEGVRKCREVIAQRAFDEFRGEEILPGPDIQSDADILAAVRGMTETDYHPCGTCRMGGDEDAVVDGEMRVRGAEGLRVVDASVMPHIISANLNAPTQMIAARAADFVLGRPQLPPFHARFAFQD